MSISNESGSCPNFKFKHSFEVQTTLDKILTQFMEIEIYTLNLNVKQNPEKKSADELIQYNSSKLVLYSALKIDLLTLVLGPQYYDVSLFQDATSTTSKGRITFKIDSRQVNKVEIISNNLTVELFKDKVEKPYEKLKVVSSDAQIIKYAKILKDIKKVDITLIREQEEEQKSNDKNLMIYKIEKSTVLSNLKQELSLYDLLSYCFTPMVYGYNPDSQKYEVFSFYRAHLNRFLYDIVKEVNSQVTKTFELLLKNSVHPDKINAINLEVSDEKEEELSTYLHWNCQDVGRIRLNFKLVNIPKLRQMPCGVFTDKGIVLNSYTLYSYYQCSKTSFACFSAVKPQLLSLYEKMKSKVETQKKEALEKKVNLEYHFIGDMIEMKHYLDQSVDEDFMIYSYENFSDIIDAQEIILNIGNFIYDIIFSLSSEDVITAFDIIKLIHQREEFDQSILSELWIKYNEEHNSYVFIDLIIQKNLVEKLISFDANTKKFLKFQDQVEEGKYLPQSKLYLCFLTACHFFKNPHLRRGLSESIQAEIPKEDLNYIQYDKELINIYPESKVLFWDLYFQKKFESATCIQAEENENLKNLIEKVKLAIGQDCKFKEITKRGTFCLEMFKNVVQLTIRKLGRENIKWLCISNFPEILNSICYEIAHKEISQYPPNFSDFLSLFIDEPKIIYPFINIIIKKTNAYDASSVYYIIDLIDSLFSYHKKLFNFQMDFDYAILLKSFQILLKIQNSVTISKMMWLYYKNAHLMANSHILEVTKIIFHPEFFNFFFHWSWKIRKMWYNIILYILLLRLNSKINLEEIEFPEDRRYEIKSDDSKSSKRLKIKSQVEEKNDLTGSYSDYYKEQMNIIYKLKKLYDENGGSIDVRKKDIIKEIPSEVPKNTWIFIERGIKEFYETEAEFTDWKMKKEKYPNLDYPVMLISSWKDDLEN